MGNCDRFGISCTGCTSLPRLTPVGGRLFLFCPSEFTAGKVRAAVPEARSDSGRDLCLDVRPGALGEQLGLLRQTLTQPERQRTRALFKPASEGLSVADLAEVTALEELIARAEGDWLLAIMQAERLTSFFQPLVEAANPERIVAYEALLRGVGDDGGLIPPVRMFDAAREAGLMVQLDQQARTTAVRIAHQANLELPLFMNLNPAAIFDPQSCLQATLNQIDEAGLPRERIVFEIVETDRSPNPTDLGMLRDFCRRQGVRIALDDFGAGYASVTLLHLLRPDIVKLDRELVREVHADSYKAALVERLLDFTQALGIQSVAEGIETEAELRWFQEHGADLAQGYLFARPAPLSPTSPSPLAIA